MMAALHEPVDAVICLAIQLNGVTGNPEFVQFTRYGIVGYLPSLSALVPKPLFQLHPPTLFAIGSQSRLCPVSAMEQVRR